MSRTHVSASITLKEVKSGKVIERRRFNGRKIPRIEIGEFLGRVYIRLADTYNDVNPFNAKDQPTKAYEREIALEFTDEAMAEVVKALMQAKINRKSVMHAFFGDEFDKLLDLVVKESDSS